MKSIKQEWCETWLPEIKKAFSEFKNPKTRYRQIPNLLTASRLFSPIVIIPVALFTNVTITFVVASLFALTDAFDGKIARKYNLKSKLGSMLDPVTDKLFALGLLIPNIVTFPILSIGMIALEGVIGYINSCSTLKGNEPHSNMLGKTKTTFVSISSIAMYLADIPIIKFLIPFLAGTTLCLQTSAVITYKIIDMKKENQKQKNKNKIKNIQVEKKETSEKILEYSNDDLKKRLQLEKETLLADTSEKPFELTKINKTS